MSLLTAMRDRAIETALRQLIQRQTAAIKDVKIVELDAGQKTFALNVALAGEPEWLAVKGDYRLTERDGKTWFEPANVQTSKEWLTILAMDLLKGRSFELPGLAKSFL